MITRNWSVDSKSQLLNLQKALLLILETKWSLATIQRIVSAIALTNSVM